MTLPKRLLKLAALGLGVAVGAVGMSLLPEDALFREPPAAETATHGDGRMYACPMYCTKMDRPGKCPVCSMEMELIVDQGDRLPLDRRQRMMLGVQTVEVERKPVDYRIRAYGKIRRDERSEAHIAAWVGGRLDRLFVDFTGTEVREGDHVAEIYSPELIAAQEELLSALRSLDRIRDKDQPGFESLRQSFESAIRASRRKLLLLGMPESVVEAVADDRKVRDHLTIYATVGGTVVEKHVDTGNYVTTGQLMFTLVDLDTVWVMLEVFEEDEGAVRIGQQVEVTVPSLPGEVFRGQVAFVDPYLDERLRVARVRVNLANPEGRLRPGAFVNAEILVQLTSDGGVHDPIGPGAWYGPMHPEIVRDEPGTCPICGMDLVQKPGDAADATEPGSVLTVPRSAILHGGTRDLVYVRTQAPGSGRGGEELWPAIYEPREIQTGFRVGDHMVVLHGLEAGDVVVIHGQFLIDSQLQLSGRPSLMAPEGAATAPAHHHAGH